MVELAEGNQHDLTETLGERKRFNSRGPRFTGSPGQPTSEHPADADRRAIGSNGTAEDVGGIPRCDLKLIPKGRVL